MIRDDDDQPLEPELRDAARAYHEPPPVPRQALWAGIQARRAADRQSPRSRRVWAWAAGIAALLALGVGIGRVSVRTSPARVRGRVRSRPRRRPRPRRGQRPG